MSKCCCKDHAEYSVGKKFRILKLSYNKIRVDKIKFMKCNNIIPDRASAVCDACVEYVQDQLMIEPSQKKIKIDESYEALLDDIKKGQVPHHVMVMFAGAIGETIAAPIYEDAIKLSCLYKEASFKEEFKVTNWIKDRNTILTSFLMAAADINTPESNIKKSLCLAGSIDSLYKARHLPTVSPVHFYKNLILYYVTGSKYVVKMNSVHAPGGSYTGMKNWLQSLSHRNEKAPQSIDTVTFFDNNQVVARNWRVNFDYKTKASVVTNLIHIEPAIDSTLQQDETLCPYKWLYGCNDHATVIENIKTELKANEEKFNNIRDQILLERINKVQAELKVSNGVLVDDIDITINDIMASPVKIDPVDTYEWAPSNHPKETPKVVVGEPSMCNPCSYASVKNMLEHIQNETIGEQKRWTIVGCDGLPYTIGSRLIERNKELQNIVLTPGAGHIEMNATKAIFKILWDVGLEDLSKMLGYRTPRALMCSKLCTDHHKAWYMLKIYLTGTMDEIIRQYIITCHESGTEHSLNNFYYYISKSTANTRFLCDSLFQFVLSLFVYRAGIRKNNTHFVMAGRSIFQKLFHATNMTNYQEIIYKDLKTRILAPEHVKAYLQNTESYSVSGNLSKGEGGDFILEAVNKSTKQWLPPGIPTEKHWLQVCRNVDSLKELQQNLSNEFGFMERKIDSKYERKFNREILEWRVKIRKSGYLSKDKCDEIMHTSITGRKLDKDLMYFERKCNENFNIYLNYASNGQTPPKNLGLSPIFVTEEDRIKFHDIGRKTKAQIGSIIENLIVDIRELGNVSEALQLEQQWLKIKVTTKNDILAFYKEVTIALEDASSIQTACEMESDASDDSADEEC